MSLELWKSIFEIGGVVLLLLTFFAGAGVVWFSRKVNEVQAQQLTQFDKGLTDAKTELGKQQERAAHADSLVEGLRLNVAKANEATERERGERVKLELELAKLTQPRKLLPEQQGRIIAELKKFPGQHFSFNVYPDPEPLAFLHIIDTLLKSAGWERVPSQLGAIEVDASGSTAGTAYDSGLDSLIAPDAGELVPALRAFASAFSKEGIPCAPHKNDGLIGKTPRAILINVGKKP